MTCLTQVSLDLVLQHCTFRIPMHAFFSWGFWHTVKQRQKLLLAKLDYTMVYSITYPFLSAMFPKILLQEGDKVRLHTTTIFTTSTLILIRP